jgi:hypothetical protein
MRMQSLCPSGFRALGLQRGPIDKGIEAYPHAQRIVEGPFADAAGLTVLRRLMDNTGMKTLFRPAPLLPAFIGLALLTCVGLASAQDSRGAGVPSVVRNAPVALDVLRGRWVRPDGGYGVVIRSVGADGQLEAMYFNPRGCLPPHPAGRTGRGS